MTSTKLLALILKFWTCFLYLQNSMVLRSWEFFRHDFCTSCPLCHLVFNYACFLFLSFGRLIIDAIYFFSLSLHMNIWLMSQKKRYKWHHHLIEVAVSISTTDFDKVLREVSIRYQLGRFLWFSPWCSVWSKHK